MLTTAFIRERLILSRVVPPDCKVCALLGSLFTQAIWLIKTALKPWQTQGWDVLQMMVCGKWSELLEHIHATCTTFTLPGKSALWNESAGIFKGKW